MNMVSPMTKCLGVKMRLGLGLAETLLPRFKSSLPLVPEKCSYQCSKD